MDVHGYGIAYHHGNCFIGLLWVVLGMASFSYTPSFILICWMHILFVFFCACPEIT